MSPQEPDPGAPPPEDPAPESFAEHPPAGLLKRWPLLATAGREPAWPQLRIPDDHRFTIIDETADYAVVNKPAPLKIHPGKPGDPPTLWDDLRELFACERAIGGAVSLINRLDRETSGLVLAAKHKAAARDMANAMQERLTRKAYLAITWDWPEEDTFLVDAPIERQGRQMPSDVWLKRCVHPAGQPSLTTFRVLQRFTRSTTNGDRFSLIEARPHTGRMHQIRVHLSHAGHPIVGDKLYGKPGEETFLTFIDSGWSDDLHRRLLHTRQALHAWKLSLPWRGRTLSWQAPLADDLAPLLTPDALASLQEVPS